MVFAKLDARRPAPCDLGSKRELQHLADRRILSYCCLEKILVQRSFGDADVFVSCAVIKEKTISFLHHSFDEDYVGDLADFFPFLFGDEDGCVGTI